MSEDDLSRTVWQGFSTQIRRQLKSNFWLRWYQSMWDGAPLDRDLVTQVALIEDAIWEAGPEAVAAAIKDIETSFLDLHLPLAEDVQVNPETDQVEFVPRQIQNAPLLSAIITRVTDSLDDVLAKPSNGLNSASRITVVLQRMATKYGNDPQRIEMDLTSVAGRLFKAIEKEEIAASDEVEALQEVVEEGARAVRANHPDIAKNRFDIQNVAIAEMSEAQRADLREAAQIIAPILTAPIEIQWKEDVDEVIAPPDPYRPLAAEPRNPALDSSIRVFGRAARLGRFLKWYPEVLERIEKSAWYRSVKVTKDVSWALSIIVGIGIAVVLIV